MELTVIAIFIAILSLLCAFGSFVISLIKLIKDWNNKP